MTTSPLAKGGSMNLLKTSVVIFSMLFSSTLAFAQAVSKDVVLTDFKATIEEVSQIFSVSYASSDYKAKRFGWNKETIVQDLIQRAEANSNLTVLEAQKLIQEFFNSTRDYHAQAYFSKQPFISIPLGFYSVQGRVYVTFLGPSYVGSIKVGDELVIYDGLSANEALAKLKTQKYANLPGTDLRDATRRLTARYVLLMDEIPSSSKITMTLKHQDGTEYEETLNWSGYPAPTPAAIWGLYSPAKIPEVVKPESPIPENLMGHMASDPFGYNSRQSYFPRPAKVTWEASDADYFYAWTGEIQSTSGQIKRVGLIRIPTFSLAQSSDFGNAVQAFKVLVEKMNQETDLLVLDVQGNRGGMLDYSEALISFFIDSPKAAHKFQYKLSPAIIQDATKTLEELNELKDQTDVEKYFGANHYFGYPLDMEFVNDMKDMYQGMIDDSKVGTLAKPRPYNAAFVKPYPGVKPYRKPLFVAVDGWSASCGDFFPAFMQDHKIATIIGTRTAGAGAFTGSGIKTTMNSMLLGKIVAPIALGYRTNGQPLENVGVIPDYTIAPIQSDLKNAKYERFQEKIFKLLDKLTN